MIRGGTLLHTDVLVHQLKKFWSTDWAVVEFGSSAAGTRWMALLTFLEGRIHVIARRRTIVDTRSVMKTNSDQTEFYEFDERLSTNLLKLYFGQGVPFWVKDVDGVVSSGEATMVTDWLAANSRTSPLLPLPEPNGVGGEPWTSLPMVAVASMSSSPDTFVVGFCRRIGFILVP